MSISELWIKAYLFPLYNVGSSWGAQHSWLCGRQTRRLHDQNPPKIQQWECRFWFLHIVFDIAPDLFHHCCPHLPPRLHPVPVHWPGGHGDWVGGHRSWWQSSIYTPGGWGQCDIKWGMQWLLSWQDKKVCILNYWKCHVWNFRSRFHICAGDDGKDSCQGDSGGPLMVVENGKYVQRPRSILLLNVIISDYLKLALWATAVSVQALESMDGLPRSSTGSSTLLVELWTPTVIRRFHIDQVKHKFFYIFMIWLPNS